MSIPEGVKGGASPPVLSTAVAYAAAGLSVIPIRPDGKKQPAIPKWKVYQSCRPSAELEGWFAEGTNGIAIIAGQVSGGLEVIDFEDAALFEQWREHVEAEAPGLLQRLPVIQTPRPGRHVYYRCAQAEASQKLARTAAGKTLIETKGEGGYVLAPGSPAACHSNGRPYEHLSGPPLTAIPQISPDERALLLTAARSFDAAASALVEDDQGGGMAAALCQQAEASPLLVGADALTRASAYLAKCDPAISGQGGHAQTFKVACALLHGFHLDDETAYSLLLNDYNPRCVPPWNAKELHHKVESARTHGSYPDMLNQTHPPGSPSLNGPSTAKKHAPAELPVLLPSPPAPLGPAALHGLAGRLVQVIGPHSEADPVALLVQALAAFGNCIGRTAHFAIEGDTHYLNLFVVLVGTSSKGRKGSSWGQVNKFFTTLEPDWAKDRVKSGLASGEGLIWAVRDPIWKTEPVTKNGKKEYEEVQVDAGVADKRLLCYEPEFASLLKVMDRQGNTLSPLLRQFWDGAAVIQTLTKNSPAKATGAHVTMIGHVTAEELRRYLSATEQANGFGNRFLWLAVQRSKLLPEGGQLDEHALDALRAEFLEAVAFARSQGTIGFDDEGRAAWHAAYAQLSEGKPGLAGCMLARAEAQVRRLACLYALLDLSSVVRAEHLQAALALWKYVEETVRCVFGNSLGDPVADDILLALQANLEGLTREQIRKDVFQGHRSSPAIARALALLQSFNLAHHKKAATAGRPEERWFAGPGACVKSVVSV